MDFGLRHEPHFAPVKLEEPSALSILIKHVERSTVFR